MLKQLAAAVFLSATAFLGGAFANPALVEPPPAPRATSLRFEVGLAKEVSSAPVDGRLFVVLGSTNSPEPRLAIGRTGMDSAPVLGRDVDRFAAGRTAVLDRTSALFPLRALGDLPAGDYFAQAVLATNRDLLLTDAPGNFYSAPVRVHLDPAKTRAVKLTLDRRLPEESLPPDTDLVKFVKLRSEKLSRFWDRPMYLRAGIVLPKDWDKEPTRRYPLVVRIGGFGTRFDSIAGGFREGSKTRTEWLADDMPRAVLLQLDGAGPLGDPYQVDSANHGPYGEALMEELIPYVEAAYRCVGKPHARFTTGGSTGGWVSLALQVFYPDQFGGCWSGYPDPADFRAVQLVDLYSDTNAFINAAGFERPCARSLSGDTEFSMRHETQEENVRGLGDSYTMSGGQWGSWNATYSPRGADGRPKPIWDARTGVIDRSVAEHWKKYDLRLVLERDWAKVGPQLRGKLHVWVGDADDYFLDGGVRRLDEFLKRADPAAYARIEFAPQKRHGWQPRTFTETLREMQAAMEANAPKSASANTDYLRARFAHAANCPHCKGGR